MVLKAQVSSLTSALASSTKKLESQEKIIGEVQSLLQDLVDEEDGVGSRFRYLAKRVDSLRKGENLAWMESVFAHNSFL